MVGLGITLFFIILLLYLLFSRLQQLKFARKALLKASSADTASIEESAENSSHDNEPLSESELDEMHKEVEELGAGVRYLGFALAFTLTALMVVVYYLVDSTPLRGHFFEWLNLLVRWVHITIGIAWIGASFYFVFLENSLNRTKGVRDELAGNLWAVHGGGFYYLEKFKNAPKQIPRELHWFKYEAYFTWVSGICLLFIVYYFNAESILIDQTKLDMAPWEGMLLGLWGLAVGWVLYDLLCKSPLAKKQLAFSLTGLVIAIGFAWFFTQVFTDRAAYIHFGALLGTIMAANVFFVIIPGQKAMVEAAKRGEIPDPAWGKQAGLRSLHNNYFTLPVLFVMISNHFPSTFGSENSWAVLAGISIASAGFKHFLNLIERGEYSIWILPVSVCMLFGVIYTTAPDLHPEACEQEIGFTEAYRIINKRCISCHSSSPTDDFYTAPPNNIVYDSPQDIVNYADKIMQMAVVTKTMPQNNKTEMTEEERNRLRCWIEQGTTLEN